MFDAWENAEVILLYYKKEDRNNIENYGISHLYKLLIKIPNYRLTQKMEAYQLPEQAGFRKVFSTVYHLQTGVHFELKKPQNITSG